MGSVYGLNIIGADRNPSDNLIYAVVTASSSSGITGRHLIRIDRDGDFQWMGELGSGSGTVGGFDSAGRFYMDGSIYVDFDGLNDTYNHPDYTGYPTLSRSSSYSMNHGNDLVVESGRVFALSSSYQLHSIAENSSAASTQYTTTWYDEDGEVFNPSDRGGSSQFEAGYSYDNGTFWHHSGDWGVFRQEVNSSNNTAILRWVADADNAEGDGIGCSGEHPFTIADKTVEGYIWYDADSNGIQDGNEQGIENVTVTLTSNEAVQNYYGEEAIASGTSWTTQTNSDGQYSISGLVGEDGQSNAPEYTLAVTKPNTYDGNPTWFSYQNAGSDDNVDSDVTQSDGELAALSFDSGDQTIDAGITPSATGLTVETSIDDDGRMTVRGEAAAGTTIEVEFPDNTTATVTVGANGRYELTSTNGGMPEGILTVKATLGNESDEVVTLVGDKSITGSVWFDENANGLRDGEESGIAEVTVTIKLETDLKRSDGTVVDARGKTWTETTDSSGNFALSSLRGGDGEGTTMEYSPSGNTS